MLDKLIEKKIKELPQNIQRAIKKSQWEKEISHIAETHHLQIDAMNILMRETLLVIVGLTHAEDFEKNLINHMSIDEELASKLVEDINERVFLLLRKIAFSHEHEEKIHEEEIIPHQELHKTMAEEGITLVDENEDDTNEVIEHHISQVAKEEKKIQETKIQDKKGIEENTDRNNKEKKDKKIIYQEPIEEKDKLGIYEHRIDTSILSPNRETNTNTKKIEQKLYSETHISHNEHFDVSPTQAEQIKEDGSFLEHIGAI